MSEFYTDLKRFGGARARVREDHRSLKRQFKSRQFDLAILAAFELLLFSISGHGAFAVLGMLFVQAGEVEAWRFRRDGRWWQTKRAIWRGATPVDVAAGVRGLA